MAEKLRTDLLTDDLTTAQAKVLARQGINSLIHIGIDRGINDPTDEKSKTPGAAKDLYGFLNLVRLAIQDKEAKDQTTDDAKVILTEEKVDIDQDLETITFSLVRKEPGAFSEGAPFEGKIKNMRPIIREVIEDPGDPGYRQITLGYWYDNIIKFTCWARTNKQANRRALWFQDLMEDYTWFFRVRGTSRVLFWRQTADEVEDFTSTVQSTTNKYYGRPLEYFVRTERIRIVSEKKLEQLLLDIIVEDS